MPCDAMQESVSRLMDDELDEQGQAALFQHLKDCLPCRLFLGTMMRFRRASASDRDALMREADERLPEAKAIARELSSQRERATERERAPGAAWSEREPARQRPAHRPALPIMGRRISAPVALALAVVLLMVGILLGSRIAGRPGAGRSSETGVAGVESTPRTIIVCGLPGIDVLGKVPDRMNRLEHGGNQQ